MVKLTTFPKNANPFSNLKRSFCQVLDEDFNESPESPKKMIKLKPSPGHGVGEPNAQNLVNHLKRTSCDSYVEASSDYGNVKRFKMSGLLESLDTIESGDEIDEPLSSQTELALVPYRNRGLARVVSTLVVEDVTDLFCSVPPNTRISIPPEMAQVVLFRPASQDLDMVNRDHAI